MAFSENLIKQRKIKGFTQDDIAEAMNVSRQSVSKWENGESQPDIGKIVKLADLLEVSLDTLFDRDNAIKTEQKIVATQDVKIGFNSNGKKAIVIGFLILILVGVVGFFIGLSWKQHTTQIGGAEQISVSGVDISSSREEGYYDVEFVPSVYKEGYTYTIRASDGLNHSTSCEAVFENGKCIGKMRLSENEHYTFILQIEYNGEIQNITLAQKVWL